MISLRTAGRIGTAWSEIGLGCWQLGGDCWEGAGEPDAILEAAFDSGVTFLDTADVYGAGRSERFIGDFLRRHPESCFVATKLGRLNGYPGPYSLESFRKDTLDSIERLGVECLDLTQLHCVPQSVLRDGLVFDWLRQLQAEGLIRHFGASIESIEDGLICMEQERMASLQVIFNVLRQKPAIELFDRAAEKGVAIIVRLPLASGLLSGRITAESQFSESDHRTFNRDGQRFHVGETFNGLPFDQALTAVDAVRPLVPEGMTMAEMSLRWILDHPAVTTIIPGASRPEQARRNAVASAMSRLPKELHDQLHQVYREFAGPYIRGEY